MAISILQASNNNGGDTQAPCVVPWGSSVTKNSGLFVFVRYTENGAHVSSVTDTLGTTYTKVRQRAGTAPIATGLELWWGSAPTSGANSTTVAFAVGKSGISISLVEGAPGTGKLFALDQSNDAAQAGTSSISHGSITTTDAIELLIAGAGFDDAFTVSALPTGWTRQNSALGTLLTQTTIAAATETTEALTTTTTVEDSIGMIASFLLVDAPPPSAVRATQIVQSLVVKPPASPLRYTQAVQTLAVRGVIGVRATQVVRTLIVNAAIPPEVGPPGCPAEIAQPTPMPADGCAESDADFVE